MRFGGRDVTIRKLRRLPVYLSWRRFERRNRREHLENLEFDARYGTDTAEEMWLTAAGVAPHDVIRGNAQYRPTWTSAFRRVMKLLSIEHDRFTFVDYGSGKGKVMLLAADYPFQQIVGVEYAPVLHEIAQRNCFVYRGDQQRCRCLVPVLGDATSFEPPETPLVCFFFNPFDGATMAAVVAALGRSLERSPRDAFLVYLNLRSVRERPEVVAALDAAPFLRPFVRRRTAAIYRSTV